MGWANPYIPTQVTLSPAATVAVSNFPASTEVSNDAGNAIPVSGTVEVTNDAGNPLPVSGTVKAGPFAPAGGDILNGALEHFGSHAVETIITVPVGRTWVGTIGATLAGNNPAGVAAATGALNALITLSGAGSAPAPGTVLSTWIYWGQTLVTSTSGTSGNNTVDEPLVIVAGANPVLVRLTTTLSSGSAGLVNAYASGVLV